jgi:PAS domain S-box-containing protein
MPFSAVFSDHPLIEFGRRARKNPIAAYGLSVAIVSFATLARWALEGEIVEGLPFITYYPAIIIATLLAGLRPGIFATILSSLVAWYLFLPPHFSLDMNSRNAFSLGFFLFMSGINVTIVALLDGVIDRTAAQMRNMRILIESAPTGIVVVDDEGVIKLVNGSAEKQFGYERLELVGKSVDELLPEARAGNHRKLREAFHRQPESRLMGSGLDLRGRRKDGSEFPIEIGLNPISQSGRMAILATTIDISDRKKAQQADKLIIRELNHRTKNLFTVFQAVASRSVDENKTHKDIKDALNGRIIALAQAYSMLEAAAWEGALLKNILNRQLAGFGNRISIKGCDIALKTAATQQFSLIVHELATNAFKYGALSTADGHVSIAGTTVRQNGSATFIFTWRESGGPPVAKPNRRGFGSVIIIDSAKQFARPTMDYLPEGLCYKLEIDLSTEDSFQEQI